MEQELWPKEKVYYFLKQFRLSDREIEVAICMLRHKSVAKCAAELRISPATVKSHRSCIYSKTGTKNYHEFIMFLLEKGLPVVNTKV